MILLLMEIDGCLMTLYLFQEKNSSTSMLKNKRKVVEESIKEKGTWIFADTKCKVDKTVTSTWNSLFKEIKDKDFQMLLQDDVTTKLSK